MNIAELINNWKKQREEISSFPWSFQTYKCECGRCPAKDEILDSTGERFIEQPFWGPYKAEFSFIATAPETIEALIKAVEEVASILKNEIKDEMGKCANFAGCFTECDTCVAPFWTLEIDCSLCSSCRFVAWLKKHGFVE